MDTPEPVPENKENYTGPVLSSQTNDIITHTYRDTFLQGKGKGVHNLVQMSVLVKNNLVNEKTDKHLQESDHDRDNTNCNRSTYKEMIHQYKYISDRPRVDTVL